MLKSAVAKFDAERKAAAMQSEQFVRSQRILDESSPLVWKAFRVGLKAGCARYPNHFTFEIRPDCEAVVRAVNSAVLEVTYLREARMIIFQYGESEGGFSICLDGEGKTAIYEGERRFITPEAAAEALLEAILNVRIAGKERSVLKG
jgi:hypothetical protein